MKRKHLLLSPCDIPVQHRPTKRLFDVSFSLFILISTAPLWLLIIGIVKISSPGPALYKSPRLGQGGRLIYCLKFRTMYKDAEARLTPLLQNDPELQKEWLTFQKLKNDPRITPIGKLLRKTSLDELPQFWNVFKGDLSVVGPRPPTLVGLPDQYLNEIYTLYGESAKKILSVRPGITGVWQVSGRSQISFDQRKQMEEEYAIHHTLLQDLILIAKTIPAVLFSKGAY